MKIDENVENYFKVDDSGEPINEFPPDHPKDRDVDDDFEIPDDEIQLEKRAVSTSFFLSDQLIIMVTLIFLSIFRPL